MVTRRQRHAAGFTLVEIMVVVGILAVLAAVATPSMGTLVDTQRARAGSTDLFTSLMRARSEAVKRNLPVTLAPADASNWAMGWSIPNPSGGSTDKLDSHEKLNAILITGPSSVIFMPSGRIKGGSSTQFEISTSRGKRCVQVDVSGRPYQTNKEC